MHTRLRSSRWAGQAGRGRTVPQGGAGGAGRQSGLSYTCWCSAGMQNTMSQSSTVPVGEPETTWFVENTHAPGCSRLIYMACPHAATVAG